MLSEIEDFVNWVRRRNPAARTWRDYSYDLAQFAALVGNRSPTQITHRDIDQFVNSQIAQGFKPATVNRRLAAILAFFTYLADEDPALVCPVIPRRHFLREPRRTHRVRACRVPSGKMICVPFSRPSKPSRCSACATGRCSC